MKVWRGRLSQSDGAPAQIRTRPLRWHLMVLVALFVAVAGTGVLTGWVQANRDALAAARADAAFGARKATEQLGAELDQVRSTVNAIGSNSGLSKVFADPTSCQLSFALQGGPESGHLDLLRPDGSVLCSSQPAAGAQAAAYRRASWLTLASRTPQLAAPVADARTGRHAVRITAPIPGLGVVAAFVDLAILGQTVGEQFGGVRQLEFVIVAADGDLIATRWPAGGQWTGRSLRASSFAKPDAAGDGVDVAGHRRVYGQAEVPGTRWRVYAGADREPALATARRIAARQALVVAFGLLVGLLATFLVHRRIARPISRLRAAVTSGPTEGPLELGDVDTGPREVVELGAEFRSLFATVQRELAERRQAEDLARRHEHNYRQMFEQSPHPIYLFDIDSRAIVAANDAAVQYYGYPRDTLLTMSAGDLRAQAQDADTAEADAVRRGRRQRHVKHDGTVTEVFATSYVVTFADREVCCVAIEDVTEREQLERRLRQSERLESLGQLAGGVAHDFNNLLGIINGYASMSAADLEPVVARDPAWRTLHDDLLQIVAAGDRATALTRQLLAFARADAVTEDHVLNLNEVVADVDRLLQRTLGADIQLTTTLTDEPWLIKADVGRLEQVLVNLAVNARDAMPHGGTLTIETDRVTADEHLVMQYPGLTVGRYMRLRVSDTGAGMSRATLERAFEPFFTTKPKGQGTGLGLATIYGIITQAGGYAHIYSEPGRGTSFVALLPVTDEDTGAAPEPSASAQPGSGESVLLVEDDDSLRTLTERILTRNGYRVLPAASPAEAIAVSTAVDQIDVLLTDVVLPGMDGPSLARELTAERPRTRVIYMSGYAETILAARTALPDGATLLNKPITAHQLLSALARAIGASVPVRGRGVPDTVR